MKIPISFEIDIPDPATTTEPSTPPYIVGNLVALLTEIKEGCPKWMQSKIDQALSGARRNGIYATKPDPRDDRDAMETAFREEIDRLHVLLAGRPEPKPEGPSFEGSLYKIEPSFDRERLILSITIDYSMLVPVGPVRVTCLPDKKGA